MDSANTEGDKTTVIHILHSHQARAGTKQYAKDTDNAPLVLSLEIGKYTIKRMLIDTAYTGNVLFHYTIAQMGIPDYEIRRYLLPLIGFTG